MRGVGGEGADGRVGDVRRDSPELEWSVGWRGVMGRSQAGRRVLGRGDAPKRSGPPASRGEQQERNGKWDSLTVALYSQHHKLRGLVTRGGRGVSMASPATWRVKEAELALGRPWRGEPAMEGAVQSSTSLVGGVVF